MIYNGFRQFPVIGLLAALAFGQDNRWVTVAPSFNVPAQYTGATLSSYNGWASLKYDSRDSAVLAWRMIIDKQRHNGIYANSIVLWSLKKNRLDLITASNYAGGTYDASPSFTLMPEFTTDNTPCPRHPYDAMAYVDSLHAVYMLLGATPRIVNFEASPGVTPQNVWDAHETDGLSTWKYSFVSRRWHRISGNIRQFWPSPYYCGSCVPFHDNHLVYWKSAHKLLFVDLYGKHAATMNLTTETWDTISLVNTSPVGIGSALSTWDSKRERMVIRTGDTVCCFDPANRMFYLLPNCGLDQGANRAMYSGIVYIPRHDVYLAVGRNGTTRVFNNTTQVWSTVSSSNIGINEREDNLQMEYDPVTDLVVLSTAASGDHGGFRTFHYVPSSTVNSNNSGNGQTKMLSRFTACVKANMYNSSIVISWCGASDEVRTNLYGINGCLLGKYKAITNPFSIGTRTLSGSVFTVQVIAGKEIVTKIAVLK